MPFIATLPESDPLFVFLQDPVNLGGLETASLKTRGVVLENVDGFDDPNKFVTRSVPHTLSMKASIASDATDPLATTPPLDKTGWAGDGAPGDGSLRSFLDGAIKQHYPKTLARQPGVDFRVATPQELDLTNTFQLALGRTNELDLSQVNLADAEANVGRAAFLDPQRGRCNVCHLNGGANFQDTGKNRNFDTGMVRIPAGDIGILADGSPFFDGGFGLAPFDALQIGFNNSLGNGAFNTPPIIEAADTPPFFHNNDLLSTDIEAAVFFYVDPFPFPLSPAARDLVTRFGTPIQFSTADGFAIARFLRALNVAFNMDIARQRLRAALTVFNRFRDTRKDIQIALLQLADVEIDDALQVLQSPQTTQPFYPVSVDRLNLAKAEIAATIAAPASSRGGPILERRLTCGERARSDRRQRHLHAGGRKPVLLAGQRPRSSGTRQTTRPEISSRNAKSSSGPGGPAASTGIGAGRPAFAGGAGGIGFGGGVAFRSSPRGACPSEATARA